MFNQNINNQDIKKYFAQLDKFKLLVNKSKDYEKSKLELEGIKTLESKEIEKSPTEKIKEVKELLDINAITKEEFENKKSELLSKV
ncbi:SHOCT domain-containing protein [Romboutsia weinsteinii]|uniref:SHOCT domain-containing protein n=1 Tax=Romboutsia weinsteinii TaxID=2020949 RepID=A0A371J5E3_9FIRM|nr:SHOCT domain-containing protein [Romboutsia weinsteinii]RDY27914.1 SHOCT domain-containing protein [Romboutsia weinsteinii]